MADKLKPTTAGGVLIHNAEETSKIEQCRHLADRPAPRLPARGFGRRVLCGS